MTKSEFQTKWGFTDDDMYIMQGWMVYYGGRITAIFERPLDYEGMKITVDKSRA